MTKKIATLTLIFCLACSADIFSQTLAFNKRISGYFIGGQFTFDIYKTYTSFYLDLRRYDRSYAIQSGQEKLIYNKLISELAVPKFLLIQHTFYPLTSLSSYLETEKPSTFNRFNTIYDINVLRSVSGSYEEPFAWSIFAGNILFMRYQFLDKGKIVRKKQAGSALAGFAYSFGYHQILDNIYFHDFWQQIEFVLVGNIDEKLQRKLRWNFRVGVKLHHSSLMNDVLTLQFERSHSLYHWDKFSFLQNSIIKYKAYFPISDENHPPHSVYQYFSYGKKFPVKIFGRTVFLVAAAGVRWEWAYRYDREENRFSDKPEGYFSWLLLPNIEF